MLVFRVSNYLRGRVQLGQNNVCGEAEAKGNNSPPVVKMFFRACLVVWLTLKSCPAVAGIERRIKHKLLQKACDSLIVT
ncbi:hypothetical protein RRG08_039189 [Elysia crispata]|uniref:Uncharacterized protein n=1 Tax=Elysia crispata TaxID=231223 RepID=A0AAE0ZDP4_9GAST|nr:hypothetical protein RRG08_039189 [Elysia crispata]